MEKKNYGTEDKLTTRDNALVKLAISQNPRQIPAGMSLTIEPDQTNSTAAGVASSHIKVRVSDEVPPASYSPQVNSIYSFPITMNISSLIELLSEKANKNQNGSRANVSSIETEGTLISAMNLISRPSSFSIVVKPYPIEEKFEDFCSTDGDPISLVSGGFAAGLSALLIDRLKNRSSTSPKN